MKPKETNQFAIILVMTLMFLSILPLTQAQTDPYIIDMAGKDWTIKVADAPITSESTETIKATAKPSGDKELSVIIKDLKEIPEFTAKFQVTTTGLTLHKQLPLTAELNASNYDTLNATHAIRNGTTEIHRPENVLNSYACFNKNGQKVAHIYGSKLTDAKGNYIWVDQNLENGTLTVYLDKAWMEKAAYPVILDPSFGYTTKGATDDNIGGSVTVGTLYALSENATVNDMKAYINWYQTGAVVHTAIYNDTGNLLAESGNNTKSGTGWAEGWLNFTISNQGLTIDDYWLVTSAAGEGQPAVSYYDSGGSGVRYAGFTFGATLGAGSVERTYSIYANYTQGLPEPTPTPTATPTATSTSNPLYVVEAGFGASMVLFAIICLNIAVGFASKGYALPATIGLLSISIACATLFTSIYADILFSPWLQMILLLLGIYGMWGAYHKSKVTG